MGSLTSLLDLSRNALANAQTAIDVTASNISNQNTVGYTRQVATFTENDTVTVSGYQQGQGASVAVASQRDRILEQRVQQQTQVQSHDSARLTGLQNLENLFTVTSTSADASGIGASINSLFNSFTALQSNPTDGATRQSVLAAAQNFAATLKGASSQISSQSSSLDQQVTTSVAQVNQLTAQLAAVNGSIATLPASADAGALEDKRQTFLTQISALVGISQTSTEHNGLTLTTANGAVLVSGSTSFDLTTGNVGGVNHVFGQQGGVSTDLTATISGGSIAGLLQVRDGDIVSTKASLDTLAYGVATAINAQNSDGLGAAGSPGGNIFSLPPTSAGVSSLISVALTSTAGIASAGVGESVGGTTNATALAKLGSSSIVAGATPSSAFANLLAKLGGQLSSATSDQTTSSAVLSQATSQRNALSGVNLDEEAAKLTQYQRSYQAAAKVFSIVDRILAAALNLGVTTSVS